MAIKQSIPRSFSDEALGQIEAGFEDVETRWASRDRIAALRSCLGTLSPTARRMLELRYASQLKREDIAAQFGREGEAVRKTLYRTRQVLGQCDERRIRAEERG